MKNYSKLPARDTAEITNPDFYNSLELSFQNSSQMIIASVKNARSPMHIGCLSYTDLENRICQCNVVLRYATEDLTEIGFHTDYRSGKVRSLQQKPDCSMMFYDVQLKTQLIFQGDAEIHYKNEISEAAWNKTPVMSRRCYLVKETPGSVTLEPTAGFDKKFTMNEQNEAETETGYENFCAIRLKVKRLDRTFLSFTGNRRCVYEISSHSSPKAQWLIP